MGGGIGRGVKLRGVPILLGSVSDSPLKFMGFIFDVSGSLDEKLQHANAHMRNACTALQGRLTLQGVPRQLH